MIVLCEPDPAVAAEIARRLAGARVVGRFDEITDADLIVLGPGVDLADALSYAEGAHTPVVLLRDVVSPAVVRRAELSGITEVVATCDACTLSGRRSGEIVTVFAAKSGNGKTTFATNLAIALNDGGRRRVCLVDLDLQFGDIAAALRLDPALTLTDAVAAGAVTTFRPGLDCVLAPVGPGEAEQVANTAVATLLSRLRHRYDHVVVDTDAQFTPYVVTALDAADHEVLVTTPDRPALKNLRMTLDILDVLSRGRRPRSIVCNREVPNTGLSPPDIEAVLKAPIACHLPAHADVPASVNSGVPLSLVDPEHEVSRAVRAFAAALRNPSKTP
ncbi:MAG TPA: division plane positioning ATPase MipZ [Amycolatopsis sp.]|nr:division plane positioning ATPase MipZ [Amycolatopsis sp.]